ncbi:DUF1643 domain-containing protein [Parahaliea sp. F7430]|uniref:DUF1643 domain-containing protein n=1 Tax=Sediminihaliea albiluteola TaxID=2758564 RepID=A0A7W2TWS4_9GAMM|nr:DUF1643 domain-containing protein [Sediminihaliea albiluteola]MBA6413393.1 DUF1643 domain-containing protein [Sediminihaliea albiluteola]
MSGKFEVTGLFYESNGYKLRKYLDIKRVGVGFNEPDLMVVMMNPGSSYPLDGIDNNSAPSEAEPDTTQQQIMKVMNAAEFNYARILNLSDLRTPDSSELYRFLRSEESSAVEHSIFSQNRRSELEHLFVSGIPVIFAWGVNRALIPLAKQAIETLCVRNPLGILKPNTRYSYYHPLPRIYAKQLEWVQHVTSQISRTANAAAV